MKWGELAELILKMSPQELNKDVFVTVNGNAYSTENTNVLTNKNSFDCVGFCYGDIYLEVIGDELEAVLEEEEDADD